MDYQNILEPQGPQLCYGQHFPPLCRITLPPIGFQNIERQTPHYHPSQVTPVYPLVSSCDSVSISEIHDEITSLNSSITDVVNFLIEHNLKKRMINLRKGADPRKLPILIQAALQCAGKKDNELRHRFYDAVLHGIIIDFIYECVEGEKVGGISQSFENFRMDIEKVRNAEAFVDAQNWTRIAAKLVEPPPPNVWEELALSLVRNINAQLWIFLGKRQSGKREFIKQKGDNGLPRLIESAYRITMKIHSGVLSQRLELTLGEKDMCSDCSDVSKVDQIFDIPSDVGPCDLGHGHRLILGNRGFGLVGVLDDGTEQVYFRPAVAAGRVIFDV